MNALPHQAPSAVCVRIYAKDHSVGGRTRIAMNEVEGRAIVAERDGGERVDVEADLGRRQRRTLRSNGAERSTVGQ